MTDPRVRIHALSGDVEVLPSTSPGTAVTEPSPNEQTRPIPRISRPTAAWPAVLLPVLTQWGHLSTRRRVAVLVLLVVATLGVLVLRLADNDTEPGLAAASEPVTGQPAATPDRVTVEPPVTPVGVPATPDATAIRPVEVTEEQLAALPVAGPADLIPAAPADPSPTSVPNGDVLHPVTATAVFTEPGGPAIVRLPVTLVGADTWVPIIDRQPGWAMVLLPSAVADGQPSPAGWIHLTPAVELGHLDRHLRIDGRTGTISVVATLGNPRSPVTDPALDTRGGRRTFMALSPAGRPTYWPASVWWPLIVRADRLCPAVWGGAVVPGLRWATVDSHLEPAGCLPTPAPVQAILRDLPAGTAILVS